MFSSLSSQQPYGQPQAQDLYSQQQFSLPQQPQSFNANILPQQMQWPPSLSPQPNTSWNQPAQSFPAPIQNGMGSHNGSLMQNQNALAMLSAMPLLPPQIVQDALRMCTPVGSSSNDEFLMTQVLYDSTANGQTYRQALESLHGVGTVRKLPENKGTHFVFRSIITLLLFGKTIIWTTSHVSTSLCPIVLDKMDRLRSTWHIHRPPRPHVGPRLLHAFRSLPIAPVDDPNFLTAALDAETGLRSRPRYRPRGFQSVSRSIPSQHTSYPSTP
jgi:hypothetical protein